MAIRIGVAGVGKVAREEYLPVLAREPDVALAYWNRTPERARAAAATFGGTALDSLAELAAWKPDAAMVLTSEQARYDVSRALIAGGLPRIFFEKPLVAMGGQAAVTEEDFVKGRELLALARERGCETAMVFNYRFFEQTQRAKREVASRSLGQVTNITALVHFACWSHCIDLVRHFAGDIAEIAALDGARHASPELAISATDVAAAFVTDTGAAGTIVGTLAMQWGHPLYELTFTFERGRVHLRDLDGALEILDPASGAHETVSLVRDHSRWDAYRDSFRKAVTAYVSSVRERRPPPVAGMEGLRELQVEAALRRAARERRIVRVNDEFPVDG
ncbi:MAG TPA: Gfo/Idh/MocA family oxidoreductase [Phycisphaerae bacterium]|nr:Gfo/Idh/MocA family oxidoreductase [Phycisphaerae bacterium]